jgi:hypothetical protein
MAETRKLAARSRDYARCDMDVYNWMIRQARAVRLRRRWFDSAADNPKWLAYSDRLVEGLRKAGMPEECVLCDLKRPTHRATPWPLSDQA